MVQTYQSPVRVYKFPFEMVMAAYEKRFPTCPHIPIFVGSEVTDEYETDDKSEHMIERLCQLNVEAPYLLKKISGVDFVYFSQKNTLNWRNRTLKIDATNVTFSSRVIVNEHCHYYIHPENSNWTCFEQTASLDVKSFFGFESTVEKIAVKHYATNIAKGKEIIEHYLNELVEEGVTRIPTYTEIHGENVADSDSAVSQLSSKSDADEKPFSAAESATDLVVAQTKDALGMSLHHSVRRKSSNGSRDKTPIADGQKQQEKAAGSGTDARGEGTFVERKDSKGNQSQQDIQRSQSCRKQHHGASTMAATAGCDRMAGGHRRDSDHLIRTKSQEAADKRLEDEYIRRFLGVLTHLEESRLCELRYWLHDKHKGKLPNDAHMLRFLRAREFDVVKAREMLLASMMWRKQHQVDKILSTFTPPVVLLQFFPGAWHHHDLEGRPIFVLRLGQMDIKGLLKSVGEDMMVKFVLSICEEGLRRTAEATLKFGKPISSWTLLVDLEGLSMRHLWRPGLRTLLKIIEIAEANYPETMGLALVVRAPRIFPVLWTLVGPLIHENTRSKFMIYGGKDYAVAGGLTDYMDEAIIPDFLGKASFCTAPVGGLVPKDLYAADAMTARGREGSDLDERGGGAAAMEMAGAQVLESLYTKAHVYKGLPHEVIVPIPEQGSVITWDFDILRGECEFQLLSTSRIIQPENMAPTAGTLISPTGLVAAAISSTTSSHASPVHFDKTLQLGVDLKIEQKPTFCREGDSIQGSHYCSHVGSYILQWRHMDLTQAQSQSSSHHFDFSLPSSQKSKLMYFYGVLNAESFKGSMMSLESCQSSFSSLSISSANGTPALGHHASTRPGLSPPLKGLKMVQSESALKDLPVKAQDDATPNAEFKDSIDGTSTGCDLLAMSTSGFDATTGGAPSGKEFSRNSLISSSTGSSNTASTTVNAPSTKS